MNFESLYEVLPKVPKCWTTLDVTKWLEWLNLGVNISLFCKASVDGSVLEQLNNDNLHNELQIKESSTKKKLLKWFKVTLSQYEQYVKTKASILNKTFKSKFPQCEKQISSNKQNQMNMNARIMADIIIKHYDEPLKNIEYCYNFKSADKIISVGRTSSSNLYVKQNTVSSHHAKIWKNEQKIYIQDLNSLNGTYIHISKRFTMKIGDMYQIGSHIFLVENIKDQQLFLSFKKQDTDKTYFTIKLPSSGQSYHIGRNKDNQLYFNDEHLSSRHTKIYRVGANYVIEDMETTNGTWLILSRPNAFSTPYQIQDRTIFKVGNVSTYQCFLTDPNKSCQQNNNLCQKCMVCKQKQKNGVPLSCRHLFACYECLIQIPDCVLCKTPIQDAMKIYV